MEKAEKRNLCKVVLEFECGAKRLWPLDTDICNGDDKCAFERPKCRISTSDDVTIYCGDQDAIQDALRRMREEA